MSWDNSMLKYVALINEYKGRQELYIRQKTVELERLVEVARAQSTEASNRIEGIVTTNARLRKLLEDKTTPRNRDEQEIYGYRDVLNLIHESYRDIPLNPNIILQLHRDLMKHADHSYAGNFKTTANEIVAVRADGSKELLFSPLGPVETPTAIETICENFNYVCMKEMVHPLILIPIFILDFLCIHPFLDGNGRMSRLLTLLLLYKSGYLVGQYVSIEKAIADTKYDYYSALDISDYWWHENENDPCPFIKYMLGIILHCYREFEDRVNIANESGVRSTSHDIVKKFATEHLGRFTKNDALIACPKVGKSSVEAALKKLVEDGAIRRIGAGRATSYVINDSYEKYNLCNLLKASL